MRDIFAHHRPKRLAGRGPPTIPVYLGDSVQWTRGVGTLGSDFIRIEVEAEAYEALWTTGQQLSFPIISINDPATFDRLVTAMADLAQTHTDPEAVPPSIAPVPTAHNVEDPEGRRILTETFKTLCNLYAARRDHMRGYFVRNQIRPLWFSIPDRRMDALVGNPPWVAHLYMTAAMQGQFKALCEVRNRRSFTLAACPPIASR